MSQEITTQKTVTCYPVTLSEAQNQLNICDTNIDEDTLIQSYIMAATKEAEQLIQKDIARTNNISKLWDFSGIDTIINEGNFVEVTGITGADDASIGWDTNETRGYHEYFNLELNSSVSADPLIVTYITGWEAENCPEIIKLAIKIKVTDYYDMERQDYIIGASKNNKVFERLLGFYKPAV